ncbi:flagellar transcriptional activator [Escherichia coli PA45]|nr:flagellar transcriptional activator [Escherichia coli PA45]
MSEKSIVQEARDIQLAMELITLGARLQMLESETLNRPGNPGD